MPSDRLKTIADENVPAHEREEFIRDNAVAIVNELRGQILRLRQVNLRLNKSQRGLRQQLRKQCR